MAVGEDLLGDTPVAGGAGGAPPAGVFVSDQASMLALAIPGEVVSSQASSLTFIQPGDIVTSQAAALAFTQPGDIVTSQTAYLVFMAEPPEVTVISQSAYLVMIPNVQPQPPPVPPPIFEGITSIQNMILAYPYVEYQTDDAVRAFFDAYNLYAQTYLDWFNALNLPIYTQSPVAGTLLDWVAEGLYGLSRPALPSGSGKPAIGPLNSYTLNSLPMNGYRPGVPATYISTSDDTFRRVITWAFYKGDGKVVTPRWIKRRINRFLTGLNGNDVPNDTTFDVAVAPIGFKQWGITLNSSPEALIFQSALDAGFLELPTQIQWTVTII